ncbi:MAG: hypothetical protein HY869_23670 [Chloroflexi bacterium]|nr:hypothetical protein [Chloroflexota bacterium]
MDQWLQWAITTIVGILGILAGRFWERFDRRSEKDRGLITKIAGIVPIDSKSLMALRENAYANPYNREDLESLWKLEKLLSQPSNFFLDNKLENNKLDLLEAIRDFHHFITDDRFISQKDLETYFIEYPDEVVNKEELRQDGRFSEEEISQTIEEDRNNFSRTENMLLSLSKSVCDKYDALMINAHKTL